MSSLTLTQTVTVTWRGSVAVVTVDDGDANVLDDVTMSALHSTFRSLLGKADAVVLAGRPGYYSTGVSIEALQSLDEDANALLHLGTELILSIVEFPRPVVSACTGTALREGAVALLGSDVRIGRDGNYKVGMDWVAHGVPSGELPLALARARLSSRHVNRAVLTAEMYSPAEAVEAGFLDYLVTGDVIEEACAVAADLVERLDATAFELTRSSTCRGLSDSIIRTAGDLWRARR